VKVSTCFVDAFEEYHCFCEVGFFGHVEGFKVQQRVVITFCVKSEDTATEIFQVLKSSYNEECLSRTRVFEWHKRFKEGRALLKEDEHKGHPSASRRINEVIQKCLVKNNC
jgi:hypothetical protein